ncbi:MAG: hypothetical protein JJE39_09515 [Vicinamibacteria bacterium]|nr:hypothetical protein [Vicinamibacteria bacterium]
MKPDEREPAAEVNRLLTDIEAARDELGTYIFEFDRRRQEALDLKLQLRKHPAVGIGVAVATAAAVAGAVAMVLRAQKRGTQGSAERSGLPGLLFKSAIGIGAARSLLGRGRRQVTPLA